MADGKTSQSSSYSSKSGDKPKSSKRIHYDYSRSNDSGSHWYSYPGQRNPLEGQKASNHQQAPRRPQQPTGNRSGQPPSRPTSPARQRLNQRQAARKQFQQNWAWAVIATTLLGITVVTSILLIVVLQGGDGNDNNAFANSNIQAEPTSILCSDPDVAAELCGIEQVESSDNVGGALEGSAMNIQSWDGESRLTILVMGMDNRPGDSQSCRTDSMMLISLDPDTDKIGILSIPRDTYVEVPNYGLERINTACILGNLERPGYGPELAMQTVQYNFGIRVNDYLMINFNAFTSMINRIGGVDIYVSRDINDPTYPDMNYGYDPFYIEEGWHHLDGETALKYARSRHDSDDIDRGRRQQEVIVAARERVLDLGMLDDLVLEAPGLWNDLDDGIDTSLQLDQIIELALYARDVPEDKISRGVVSWEYLFSYRTPTGGQVVVPRRSTLGDLMQEVFGENYGQ